MDGFSSTRIRLFDFWLFSARLIWNSVLFSCAWFRAFSPFKLRTSRWFTLVSRLLWLRCSCLIWRTRCFGSNSSTKTSSRHSSWSSLLEGVFVKIFCAKPEGLRLVCGVCSSLHCSEFELLDWDGSSYNCKVSLLFFEITFYRNKYFSYLGESKMLATFDLVVRHALWPFGRASTFDLHIRRVKTLGIILVLVPHEPESHLKFNADSGVEMSVLLKRIELFFFRCRVHVLTGLKGIS